MPGKRILHASFLFALPLFTSGFGVVSRSPLSFPDAQTRDAPSAPSLTLPRSPPRGSPLFASVSSDNATSAADSLTEGNKAALRSIEKKIEEAAKQRDRFMEKVNKFDDLTNTLEQKKNNYLEGITLGKVDVATPFSETTVRSAVKALMWRVIAGTVTFITSLKFSGSIKVALTIVGSDFLSKAATMFIGERLMNKSQAGRSSGADGAGRSLTKALVWRLFAICNTLTMSLLIAKDLSMASKIAGSDAIFKTGLMFFYERVWANVEWGKEYQVEFAI